MRKKVRICLFYDNGINEKINKAFKEKDLENYLYMLEESCNFSYINERKISLYDKKIKALITVETIEDKIYRYISAGRYRNMILCKV